MKSSSGSRTELLPITDMIRSGHRFCASSGSLRQTQARPSTFYRRRLVQSLEDNADFWVCISAQSKRREVREIGSGLTEAEALEKWERWQKLPVSVVVGAELRHSR
jgi:hypothetical protein